jgi:tellurite resistance protein TehA-like permease
MNKKNMMIGVFLLIVTILNLAVSSSAVDCFNAKGNEKYKEDNKGTFNFNALAVFCGVVSILVSFVMIYFAFKSDNYDD